MLRKQMTAAIILSTLAASNEIYAAAHHIKVTPFTDNLTVNLIHFSNISNPSITYQSDNDINISGPSTVTSDHFMAQIMSHNKIENGYPRLTLQYATTSGPHRCTLDFIDGPWTMLNYRYKNPPACEELNISPVTLTNAYQYTLNIAMKDS